MKINFSGDFFKEEALIHGILTLAPDYDFIPVFNEAADITLTASHGEANQLSVKLSDRAAEIVYDKKIHFFRGLGLLLIELKDKKTELSDDEGHF